MTSHKSFEPHDKLHGLRDAAKEGNAYKHLKTLDSKTRAKTINQIFKKHFEQDEVLDSSEETECPARTNPETILRSLNSNEFQLTVSGTDIRIVLGHNITIDRQSDTIRISLARLPTHPQVQQRLDEIDKEQIKRKRRSMLSEYYLDCCMLNDTEPKIKYPHGNEETYKKLIQDLCSTSVELYM